MAKRIIKEQAKQIPLGIKLISILGFLISALLFYSSIKMLVEAILKVSVKASQGYTIAIPMIVLASLILAASIGLLKLKKWARVLTLAISILAMLWALEINIIVLYSNTTLNSLKADTFSMIMRTSVIIAFFISLTIILYLSLNQKAKLACQEPLVLEHTQNSTRQRRVSGILMFKQNK